MQHTAFYCSSLYLAVVLYIALHFKESLHYSTGQNLTLEIFCKVVLEWSPLNCVAFLFLSPFRGISALCVFSPAFRIFCVIKSRLKQYQLKTEKGFCPQVWSSHKKPFDNLSIFHYQQYGKKRLHSMRFSLVLFNPYRWFCVVL